MKHFSSLGEFDRFRYESIFGFARKIRSYERHKGLQNKDGMGDEYASEDEDNLFWKNKLEYRLSE